MLFACMRAELMKLKRSFIWSVFLILPVISTIMGCFNYIQNTDIVGISWYSLWTQTTLFYSNFFLCAADCSVLRLPVAPGKFQPQPQCAAGRPGPHSLSVSGPVSRHLLRHPADTTVGRRPVPYLRPYHRAAGLSAFGYHNLAATRLCGRAGHCRAAAVLFLLYQKLCPAHCHGASGQRCRTAVLLGRLRAVFPLFPHASGNEFQ